MQFTAPQSPGFPFAPGEDAPRARRAAPPNPLKHVILPLLILLGLLGMLIHDFPDGLSEGGWYHNLKPMQKRDDEIMSWGTPIKHPRQADGQAEP